METTQNKKMVTEETVQALEHRDDEINLVELFFRLLEKAKHIILAAVIGAILAGVYTQVFVTPLYTATAKLYVVNVGGTSINLSDLQIGSELTADYKEVFNNWHVHELVLQKLGLSYSYGKMSDMLDVSSPSGTRILYIKVTSPDPNEAKLIADTYAEVAQEFIATTMDTEEPNIFEEALLPSAPVSPSMVKNVAVGFILGAFIACAIITIIFLLDDKVRTSEDVERYFGMSTLGMLPLQSHKSHPKKKTGGAA